jgi:hypothetical protein
VIEKGIVYMVINGTDRQCRVEAGIDMGTRTKQSEENLREHGGNRVMRIEERECETLGGES